jgi:glycine cleavage system H lipoate-binding protein
MNPHDFMTMHAAKTVEYLIAVSYLLLFIPFWRFVNGPAEPAVAPAHAARHVAIKDWFAAPEGLFYHPGHAWLRVESADTVTVGFDDFAGKLVGAPSGITLPALGATLAQGVPAWALLADGKAIAMLSPVDGTVVAVNDQASRRPALAHERPYADGWLLKVQSARLAANLKQLLTGRTARRWMDDLTDGLRGDLTPALGQLAEDGGVVIDGLARALEPDSWDQVARRFFLTDDGDVRPGAPDAAPALASKGGNHV